MSFQNASGHTLIHPLQYAAAASMPIFDFRCMQQQLPHLQLAPLVAEEDHLSELLVQGTADTILYLACIPCLVYRSGFGCNRLGLGSTGLHFVVVRIGNLVDDTIQLGLEL